MDKSRVQKTDPCIQGLLIYHKWAAAIQWKKDGLFNGSGSIGFAHGKMLNLDPYLTPCTEVN